MTVEELRRKLKAFAPDWEVVVESEFLETPHDIRGIRWMLNEEPNAKQVVILSLD